MSSHFRCLTGTAAYGSIGCGTVRLAGEANAVDEQSFPAQQGIQPDVQPGHSRQLPGQEDADTADFHVSIVLGPARLAAFDHRNQGLAAAAAVTG